MMGVPFTIVGQDHDWQFDSLGNRVGRWIVRFQTPSGIFSEVIIPDDSYHPKTVARAVAEHVDMIERVQALTEGDVPESH